MDAAQALADLTEVSSQIEGAALAGAGGTVLASTFAETGRGERVVEAALPLVGAAERRRSPGGGADLTSVVAVAGDGGVFVVRDGDRMVVAVTGPDPTVGLVLYDLKTCLRLAAEDDSGGRTVGGDA